MYNFFIEEEKRDNCFYIVGTDYNHIKNVLRMKIGDNLLVSNNGKSSLCKIKSFEEDTVIVEILENDYLNTDLPISITLMQGLPKSDKLELIIQKSVELGVDSVIPVEMARSIVKIDKKKQDGKIARFQAIAESAAKQSKRNSIPSVGQVLTFKQALEKINEYDLFVLPYESQNGMESTKETLSLIKKDMKICVMIGPEGGFDEKEILLAKDKGAKIVSLGKRILRTETAAITTLSMLMLYAEMKLM